MARRKSHHSIDLEENFTIQRDELSALMRVSGTACRTEVQLQHGNTEQLCSKLRTDIDNGIPLESVTNRERAFGRNVIPMKKPKTFLQLIWNALKEPTLVILEGAAVISLAVSLVSMYAKPAHPIAGSGFNSTDQNTTFGNATDTPEGGDPQSDQEYEWIEAVAIMLAVCLVVLVSAVNDYGKEKQFQALQNQVKKEQKVTVTRNGAQSIILNTELVVGDICILKYGDIVPADGLVLQSHDLSVDESSLTGESDHVKKDSNDDIRVLSGTNVMEGTGKIVVVAVGVFSQTGIIYSLLGTADNKSDKEDSKDSVAKKEVESRRKSEDNQEEEKVKSGDENQQSVLQKKLALIATRIGKVGLFFAVATSLILIIRFCVEEFAITPRDWMGTVDVVRILNFIIIGITILVVAIPEGLPLAVTLTLAVSAKKMMKDHNLVRNLFACETMGCATTICSDKTGTLTTNRMTVTESYLGGALHSPYPDGGTLSRNLLDMTAESVSVNSNYTTNVTMNSAGGGLPVQLGNKTECSLLYYVQSIGYDYMQLRSANPESSFAKVYTFNSNRKSMSTVISTERGWRVHCKGAAEIILAKCDFIMQADGTVVPLSDTQREVMLENVVSQMASSGLRTICVAFKNIICTSGPVADHEEASSDTPFFEKEDKIVGRLTCLAVFGIEDPVRPEVPNAIVKCRSAGVTVRMLTGDNVNTAKSIAMKCGIITLEDLTKENVVLEGDEFNRRIRNDKGNVDQEKFDNVWTKLRVLARSTPQDKYTLVDGIIKSRATKHREVVAVTGDGTNDAPALKKAHVGFAMGIAGTEVAKDASDIIITDDNFISIVKACVWGRNIYDNICKFLQFQLTVNVTALFVAIVGAAANGDTPLKAVPMLWVNLIQDTLASLALATEPPSDHLLDRKPYGRKANIMSRIMIRNILGHGFYQLVVLFTLLFGQKLFNRNPEFGLAAVNPWESSHGETTNRKLDTLIFNAFVFMTIFNLINARCIHNERNVLARLFRNPFFIVIFLTMIAAQAIVVEFGGAAFKTVPLTGQHWAMCLAFGVGSLIWNQVLCFIPTKGFKARYKQNKIIKRKYNLSPA